MGRIESSVLARLSRGDEGADGYEWSDDRRMACHQRETMDEKPELGAVGCNGGMTMGSEFGGKSVGGGVLGGVCPGV